MTENPVANYAFRGDNWVNLSDGHEVKDLKELSELVDKGKELYLIAGSGDIRVPASVSKSNPEEVKKILDTLVTSGNASTGPTEAAINLAKQEIDNLKPSTLSSAPATQPISDIAANQGTESNKWVNAKPTTAQAPQIPPIGNHKSDNPTIETQAQHPGVSTANPLEMAKAVNPAIKDKDTAEATYKALHPTPIEGSKEMKELNEATLEEWKRQGIVDKDGNLDFTKLGDPPLSAREVRKAHLKGKVWIDETGKFEMKVNFQFGENAYKGLKNLKEKTNSDFEPKGENSPISIDPRAAKELSAADLAILKRGGQIQFKALGDGRMLKITAPLGEEDASKAKLKIKIFGDDTEQELDSLSEVFKNLENWQELAGKMAIKKEIDGIPFTSRFDVIKKSNEDDPERIQAENAIWDAIYAYLGTTINQPAQKPEAAQQPNTKPDEVQGMTAREIKISKDISENSKNEIASKTPVSTAAEQAKEVGEQNPLPNDFQGIFNSAKNIPNLELRPNKEPEISKAQKINIEESPAITAKRTGPQITTTKTPIKRRDYSDLIRAGKDVTNSINNAINELKTNPEQTAPSIPKSHTPIKATKLEYKSSQEQLLMASKDLSKALDALKGALEQANIAPTSTTQATEMNSETSTPQDLNVKLQEALSASQNLQPDEHNALNAAKKVSAALQQMIQTETNSNDH